MVDSNVYQVVVEGDVETTHRVHMSQEYYRELCGATITHEYVLIQAFRFLLEREPNTAILEVFDITDINRHFPDFESRMKQQFA